MPRSRCWNGKRLRHLYRLRSRALLFVSRRERSDRSDARVSRAGLFVALEPGTVSNKSALPRRRHEVKQLARRSVDLRLGRLFQRLFGIESAPIKKFERVLDFGPVRRAQSRPAQPDRINPEGIVRHRCDKRRDASRRAPLRERKPTDANVLMKHRTTA